MWLLLAPTVVEAGAIHDTAKGDVKLITAILDEGADVNEIAGNVTPLYLASSRNNLDAAKLLIGRGADVNLATKFGTPLLAATKFGNTDMMALLIESGADPNLGNSALTPLHQAAKDGSLDCVAILVDAGADVNALTPDGEPAIHFAKREGHDEVVSYLRDHGVGKLRLSPIASKLAKADLKAGEDLFKKFCSSCHISMTRVNSEFGPPLWGIVGRRIASVEGYEYSAALKEESDSWTFERLNAWLSNPMRAIPGTRMRFPGLHEEERRVDMVAYLRTLDGAPVPLPQE
jgi:cytochrome c